MSSVDGTGVVPLAVAALAIAAAVTTTQRTPEITHVAAGVEDDGADCPVTLPGSLTAQSRLPDPFTKLNGTHLTAKSEWPRSGSVAPLGGAEIYKALDAGADISYWSDVQDGTHCASRSEWRTPLQQSIQRFLRNTGSAPAVFRISSRKAGNLAEWRNWQTPTLSDGGPTDPPPATGCAATASVNQWTGGFVATVRVTAGSSPVGGWTVTAALPSGASIVNSWEATRSANTGTVAFTNLAHNGVIAAGQSVEFGCQGTGTGTGVTPSCTAR